MQRKLLIVLLSFLSLMTIPFVVNAATITSCNLDKETYLQGQTGYMTVRIYNDKDNEIRITELTATIDYYYTDGNVYLQTFYTNADLPIEIQQGHSSTFDIPFSLPTNIASGYTDIYVRAKTELWEGQSERWMWSDHPTYQQELFIESPFKQELEDQQAANQQLQTQLQEEQSINEYITKMAYFFGATTILLAALTGFLIVLYRKTRIITQPAA